jgi:hypothetical protein
MRKNSDEKKFPYFAWKPCLPKVSLVPVSSSLPVNRMLMLMILPEIRMSTTSIVQPSIPCAHLSFLDHSTHLGQIKIFFTPDLFGHMTISVNFLTKLEV